MLSCYTTKELIPLSSRPQFVIFRILLGSAFTVHGLFPSAPPFNTCDYLKLQNSELDRASRSLGFGVRTTQRRARERPTGLLWFSKTGRMKLGINFLTQRYHRYQSKKISNIVSITKILICISLKYLKMYSIVFFFFFLQSHASTCI